MRKFFRSYHLGIQWPSSLLWPGLTEEGPHLGVLLWPEMVYVVGRGAEGGKVQTLRISKMWSRGGY